MFGRTSGDDLHARPNADHMSCPLRSCRRTSHLHLGELNGQRTRRCTSSIDQNWVIAGFRDRVGKRQLEDVIKSIPSRHHTHTHSACSFKSDVVWYMKLEVPFHCDVPGKGTVFVIGIISCELLSIRV